MRAQSEEPPEPRGLSPQGPAMGFLASGTARNTLLSPISPQPEWARPGEGATGPGKAGPTSGLPLRGSDGQWRPKETRAGLQVRGEARTPVRRGAVPSPGPGGAWKLAPSTGRFARKIHISSPEAEGTVERWGRGKLIFLSMNSFAE